MSIRIISRTFEAAGGGSADARDGYLERIVKYVPAEVVTAWLFVKNLITLAAVGSPTILWGAFIFGVVITPALKYKQTGLPLQAAISTGAFAVWVFALGQPLANTPTQELYGTLALVGYTLFIGLFSPD